MAVQNIFGDLALDETLKERLPQTAGKSLLVGNSKTKWRFEGRTWGGASDEIWDLIQTGDGMTIGVDGTSGGSRYLKITTGTTINQETIIQSKQTFKPPFNLSFGLTLSQNIANQEVHIEFVEVDDNGDVIIDNELFSAPNFNDARSGAGLRYSGTTTSSASIKVRSRGISELVKAEASHGTGFRSATGSSPNFNPTLQGEISFTADRVITASRTIDSNTNRAEGGRSTTYVPDPDGTYKIRLRVKNLGTAPASSTDVRLHFAKIIDQTRLSVDFGAIAGSLNGSDAPPVWLLNPPTSTPSLSPSTSSGMSTNHHLISAATTNLTSVKTSAGVIGSINISNVSASVIYFKLYNKASAPVLASDVPVQVYAIQPNTTFFATPGGAYGSRFTTGIAYAITGGVANNDTAAIGASEVIVSLNYT